MITLVEEKFYIAELFDLYGLMLTDKQQECLRLYLDEDFSLAEIGEELGISRQAVHDNIQRAEQTLMTFEDKLGIHARNAELQNELKNIAAELQPLLEQSETGRKNFQRLVNIISE